MGIFGIAKYVNTSGHPLDQFLVSPCGEYSGSQMEQHLFVCGEPRMRGYDQDEGYLAIEHMDDHPDTNQY